MGFILGFYSLISVYCILIQTSFGSDNVVRFSANNLKVSQNSDLKQGSPKENQLLDGNPTAPTFSSGHFSHQLPSALIIGAKKSGTRALLEFLKLHPDVQAPGPEIHYFDRKYNRGIDWYRSRMPPTLADQITIEKTPAYFVKPEVPARIKAMQPSMKLILVLRNPVNRVLSDYTQSLYRKGPSIGPFESHVLTNQSNSTSDINTDWMAIRVGMYNQHLKRWLTHFPANQIHLVSGEELVSSPGKVMQRVQTFLGLEPIINERHFFFNQTKGFYCVKKHWQTSRPECLGQTKGRQHPQPDPEVLKALYRFYVPYNQALYRTTGIDFGWNNVEDDIDLNKEIKLKSLWQL